MPVYVQVCTSTPIILMDFTDSQLTVKIGPLVNFPLPVYGMLLAIAFLIDKLPATKRRVGNIIGQFMQR